MRGEVLLVLDQPGPRTLYADYFRAHDLRVHEAEGVRDALKPLDDVTPEVIVARFSQADGPSLVQALRRRTDYATSIIVIAAAGHREAARAAGADCLVTEPALPSDVLYQVHRALILRRSGRRLPWS